VFDDAAHAASAARIFAAAKVWAIGVRLVLIEGVPQHLAVGLPERIAAVPALRVSVEHRPPVRQLAPLPDTANTLLAMARKAPDPVQASLDVAGGLRLEPDGGESLGPGEAWIAHTRVPMGHVFLSLMGDGISDPTELVAAFKKGLVLDKKDVAREKLDSVKRADYTFQVEHFEWSTAAGGHGSALVLEAPACGGAARILVTAVPAPAERQSSLALDEMRGQGGLDASLYCAKVRELSGRDLP
jgi:hypothetical protein